MLESVQRLVTVICAAGITALAISADSVTALTGAEDGSACLTNIQTGRLLGSLPGNLH